MHARERVLHLAQRMQMKIVLIIIGSLAALYTPAAIVQFISTLLSRDPSTAYGMADIAASAAPVCIGLLVSIACFSGAFKKTPQ